MDYARNPSPIRSAIPTRLAPSSRPLKTYNRSHMQPALRSPIPDASLAVLPVNGENSHQGFAGRNPAPNQVREACKFTVLLGMRGRAELNRAGSRCPGKERDTESGNDYFGARYYASSMGRWMSPDKPFADQHPGNPQSWNLYSYVRNNPLSSIDTDGQVTIEIKYNPVAGGAANHSFIVITDRDGTQTVFRAGPTLGGAGLSQSSGRSQPVGQLSGASSGSASQSSTPDSSRSDSSNSSSPGAGTTPQGNPFG